MDEPWRWDVDQPACLQDRGDPRHSQPLLHPSEDSQAAGDAQP